MLKLNGPEKFECLQHLDSCISCLEAAIATTTSAKAIESIKLQISHHIKHRDLILHHYEKYKKLDKQKSSEIVVAPLNERVVNSNKMHLDLFENIESTDSLLEELKKTVADNVSVAELQQTNSQLNLLLYQLITHHGETIQENDQLKDKIKLLETELKLYNAGKGIDQPKAASPDKLSESPDIPDETQEFAPLDLPVFDLESLKTPKQ